MAFPEELKRAFPSYGPDWDKAIEMGIDVSMLLENLKLTPDERLKQLEDLLNETQGLKAVFQLLTDGSID
jgi:hypothetical protein